MPAPDSNADREILDEARKRFQRCVDWEKVARERALRDTRFAEADSYNMQQWDAQVLRLRQNRPCLTHNKVRQHNLMIVNDARQNKAQIKITPTGDRATYESAQVFAGIIRRIEYQSKAIDAYSTATFHQVQSGIGYCRVVTEYDRPDSFDQEIYIRRIADPRTVYIDPDAKEYDKADMKFAFVFSDIPREIWEEEHGPHDMPPPVALDNASDLWVARDHIRIAEYWRRTEEKDTLHRLHDGTTMRDSEMDAGQRTAFKPLISDSRETTTHAVEWFKIVGDRIEDSGVWAGKYIPIVPCIGEETVIDGVMDRKGHTRSQLDAQRIYNYWAPLALHTRLPTPTGWTTMGEVQTGDQLLDEQGRPTTVIGLSPVFVFRKCLRVEFDDGSHIIADAQHPWQVEERGKAIMGGWQWTNKVVTTADLMPGKHFIHMPKPLDLPDVDLPIEPYLLGVWLGDGRTDGSRITGKTDIDEFREHLAQAGCRLSPVHKDGAFSVYDVWEQFVRMGLAGNKHIPEIYLRASAQQRWALLQGLMDTDGSANARLHTCTFYSTLPRLADGFSELLSSLGLKAVRFRRAAARRKMPNGNICDCLPYDQFTFSAPPDVQVFRLRRKRTVQERARVTHWRRTKRFRITNIEPMPSEPVRCVGVDAPSHLFLAGPSMVPTHNSAAVEQVALQTKTPFIADVRAIENHEKEWDNANVANKPYLPYNGLDDSGKEIAPPARAPSPEMSQAYIQGMMISRQDLLDVTGQYQAELGMPSNERSGVAIQQRQRQGDQATYHYIDNQAKMIRQVGRILLDLVPKIYDVPRVMKIMGEDGSEQDVLINPGGVGKMRDENGQLLNPGGDPFHQVQRTPSGGVQSLDPKQQDQQRLGQELQNVLTIFDPQTGRYDVEADVGPAYGTQRQEAANAFSQIMQANPAAFQLVGDFWAQNSDFPGADQLADRLRRGLPPQYTGGPSPQEQQLQAALQHTQQNAQTQLQRADAEIATLKAQLVLAEEQAKDKAGELENDTYKAETDRLKAVGQIDPHAMQIVVRQLLRDMMQTDIIPHLRRHAEIQGELQQTMAPPEPVNGTGTTPSMQ